MKHFYLLAVMLLNAMAFYAQRNTDLSATLTYPSNGQVILPMETFNIDISLLNSGPDNIVVGDTLALKIYLDGIQLIFQPGNVGYIVINDVGVPSGMTYVFEKQMAFAEMFDGNYVEICVEMTPMNSQNPVIDPVASNDSSCVTVLVSSTASVDENQAFFELYPNPASDYIRINTTSELSAVEIRNSNGALCTSEVIDGKVNIAGLSSGVYFVTVKTATETGIQKLVIEK